MTRIVHGLTRYDSFVRECVNGEALARPFPQIFGRIGPKNPIEGAAPDGKPFGAKNVIPAFRKALDAMKDASDPTSSDVPAGMTFFGQFIDHDVTMDATSAIGQRIDPRSIRNIRTPGLDLDCVYGDGPDATPHLYHPDHHGYLLFGRDDNPLDLARNGKGTALIGDPRNDENIIVSQIQGLFISLHNILMTALAKDPGMLASAFAGVRARAVADGITDAMMPFEAARRILRLHYHWLIINDFLPAFVDAKVLKQALHHIEHGTLPPPFSDHSPVMPIEFAGAAYRFGHATVQNEYTIRKGKRVGLFEMRGFEPRDKDFNIEFAGLLDVPGGGAFDKARPVGRKLPASIYDLPFVADPIHIDGETLEVADAKKLPHRNVFRDRFALELASGQQMARLMNVAEIKAPVELTSSGVTKTPLWYYCLHEAESHGGKLGPVGGGVVATTLLRLLALDHESLLCSAQDFKPWAELGATKAGGYSLGHLAKFVENNRDGIDLAPHLRCG